MKDSILRETEDGTKMVFSGGKEFVEAVAHASSKEELRQLLKAGGIYEFSEEELRKAIRTWHCPRTGRLFRSCSGTGITIAAEESWRRMA